MNDIENILSNISHRPWELPIGKWEYYQEWNDALFLHFEIPYSSLRKLVPEKLTIDSFNGKYYISIVAFTMQKIRPKNLPPLKLISDFHEINVRTYIDNDNKKGVYFLNIEAEKILSVLIAKKVSGLPYEKSNIKREFGNYKSFNILKNLSLDIKFLIGKKSTEKTDLELWLTERYSLYLKQKNHFFRYEIHHKQWDLNAIEITKLDLNYKIGEIELKANDVKLKHYSNGVKVVSWKKEKLK